MTDSRIRDRRLKNQQITATSFTKPAEIVSWMCAIQAQVYPMAKWAIGLRLPGSTNKEIDETFNKGDILRTHVLRPTWHFVLPEDIRWLLKLTAPRVHAFNRIYYKQHQLETKDFNKCNAVLEKTLHGGKQLTRTALQSILSKSKITADGTRLALLMMQAELDGIICSGKREGKQFTYALLEELVPPTKPLIRQEALARLTQRYFESRGPATVNDFSWWSGLTVKDCREGIFMLDNKFTNEQVGGVEYFYYPGKVPNNKPGSRTFLMPDYDEYGIAYKDRSALFSDKVMTQKAFAAWGFPHVFVIDGIVTGTWKLMRAGGKEKIETFPFIDLPKNKEQALQKAIRRYHAFIH